MTFGLVILLILSSLILFIVYLYNSLVGFKVLVDEAWSGIDVQLKKRHDLIPNLIEIVKSYSSYEKETLVEVTRARNNAQATNQVSAVGKAENELTKELKHLLALAEDYPELKANESFMELQSNLVAIEDDIQFARRYYNGAVRNYSTAMQKFPSNMIASSFSFKPADFFELSLVSETSVPDVNLD